MRFTPLLIAAFAATASLSSSAAPPAAPAPAAGRVRHALRVVLDPQSHRISVDDEITIPPGANLDFLLNARLQLTASEPSVR